MELGKIKVYVRKLFKLKGQCNFAPPVYTPPPCTLPSSVHCPIYLHTEPGPTVYTALSA